MRAGAKRKRFGPHTSTNETKSIYSRNALGGCSVHQKCKLRPVVSSLGKPRRRLVDLLEAPPVSNMERSAGWRAL